MSGPNTNYTLVVTSCDRFDLLKTTLESYFKQIKVPPREVIVIEDSDREMPEFLNDSEGLWRQRSLKWISNGKRMGQIFSIDRAYREVKTDFVMHMEDDWLFQNNAGDVIEGSKKILNEHPEIIQVSLRGDTGWHPLVSDLKYPFQIAEPYWRGVWGGIAFNPGLRRLSDYKRLGSYGAHVSYGQSGLQHEEALSKILLDQGYRIADLGRPICTHIGGTRSRAKDKLPPLPKILIAIPTCFAFDYETHKAPGCEATGFHQNGANEQTQAVRETWATDVEPFKEHVDLRFFYGKPESGYPREPLADEVFLDCGDGYDSLIQKSTLTFAWAAQRNYKFTYKCDTDTWCFVDRLVMEILENRFDYAGYLHCDVCSGGPGYLLSDHACRIVAQQGRTPRHAYAEDVHVSKVLGNAGIRPLMLPNHRPGFSDHFFFWDGKKETFDPSKLTDELVTMHAVFPQAMRDLHAYLKKLPESK